MDDISKGRMVFGNVSFFFDDRQPFVTGIVERNIGLGAADVGSQYSDRLSLRDLIFEGDGYHSQIYMLRRY